MNCEISNMPFVRGWEEQFTKVERELQETIDKKLYFVTDRELQEFRSRLNSIKPQPLSIPQLWEISRISKTKRQEFEESMRNARSYNDFLPTTKISTTIYYSPFIAAVALMAFGLLNGFVSHKESPIPFLHLRNDDVQNVAIGYISFVYIPAFLIFGCLSVMDWTLKRRLDQFNDDPSLFGRFVTFERERRNKHENWGRNISYDANSLESFSDSSRIRKRGS